MVRSASGSGPEFISQPLSPVAHNRLQLQESQCLLLAPQALGLICTDRESFKRLDTMESRG